MLLSVSTCDRKLILCSDGGGLGVPVYTASLQLRVEILKVCASTVLTP